jgi:hypothetical protein
VTTRSQPYLTLTSDTDEKECVEFRYKPASVSVGKSADTKDGNTIKHEDQVTDAHAWGVSLNGLRLEGPQSLGAVKILLEWVGEPGQISATPPRAGSQSGWTSATPSQRQVDKPPTPKTSSAIGKHRAGKGKPNKRIYLKRLRLKTGDEEMFPNLVVLKKVTVEYTRFSPAGDPIRANVKLELQEVAPPLPPQNPTSGGPGGGRMHLVTDGDSLQHIAAGMYDSPAAWRDIAAANGIDDPLRVRNGRSLMLPDQSGQGR